jgi:hypothetical protein
MISVKNNRIILRSKRLDKEVLPRLGNAHNYSFNSLPIYYFLCSIQAQNKRSSIGFNWNNILLNQAFLPRVEFENTIFSKARWLLETNNVLALIENKDILTNINVWKESLLMPNFVELVEGDNRLLINLENEASIKMLFNTIKNRKQFVLEEYLFNNTSIVKDIESNNYCNQFVVSFFNNKKLKHIENE